MSPFSEDSQIVAYRLIGVKDLYDLTVPGLHNYVAAGVVHHNTYSGAAEVAFHATGKYPDWWTGYRFSRATRWIVGSESAELTRKGVQRLLVGPPEKREEWGTGAIPKEDLANWSMKPGVPDAVSSITVKNVYGGESVIQFNSYDQGRMQHVDSRVLTPTGWRRIGDLRPGDEVIAGDGSVTSVEGVFPHGVKDLYELTFDSGVKTLAGEEHLWLLGERTRGPFMVRTTADLIERYGDQGERPPANRQVSMPNVGVVQLAAQRAPLDPYLAGALLGDGCLRGGRIRFTSADAEIVERVRAGAAQEGAELVSWGGIQYGFKNANLLRGKLELLGMMGPPAHEKRVPEVYLWNAPGVRLEVLRGLMDTAGTVSKKGSLGFATTSSALAEDVSFLIRSFGGKAAIWRVEKGRKRPLYKLSLRMPAPAPFHLARKAERCVRPQVETHRHLLRHIRKVEPGEAVCIAVAHPSRLYVTDDFIVTHNTKWQADTLDGVWCVAEGQRVLLADGTYVPIERVLPGDVVVTTDGRGRRAEARVSAVHDNGVRDVVEVRMARGPWLVMTPDHEVYTTTRRKTPVATAERVLQVLPGWEPRETKDREDAWYAWLGLVLAEGSVSCRKITMADGDAAQQAAAMLPRGAYVRRKDMPGAHVPDWFLNWPEFWEQADPGLAHEKQIPDWVFRSSNAKVAQFLAYLYAGDGWASGKTIGYASTSRLLAEQVSVLLARLGIRGSVNKKVSTRENWRDQWWVLINSADAVLRFVDRVAVPGKAPAMARARVEAERRAAVRPRSGRYPNGKDRFASVRSVTPAGTARVFDLTVEGTHRFVLGTHVVSNCDEEPPIDIYTEALTRTNATGGPVFITFTPLLGMSQVVKRFLKEKPEGTTVVNMTIDDVEHYTPEQRAAIVAAYPEHEREARARGVPMMGSGQVFPVAESMLSCEPLPIPPHWARICAIDFGWDHPAAFVCLAHDRDTDTVYVYDAWRMRKKSAAEQAMVIMGKGYKDLPWAWPHDGLQHDKGAGQVLVKQYKEFGVNMLPERAQFERTTEGKAGGNSVEAGIEMMLERMQTRRLRVFNTLTEWFEEFRQYHRKDGVIVKEDDDLMSATRYGLMMLRKARSGHELVTSRPSLLAPISVAPFEVFDTISNY